MNYFDKGNEFYNAKNYADAISMYRKSAEIKENEASSLYNTSVCFIKLKEYKKAIPFLEDAIEKKRHSKYYFNLGYCYSMLNDKKKALLYFNTAWSLDDTDKDCEKAINLILNEYKKKSYPNF